MTLVLGNDVRRRTAFIGGLALLALSLFLAGAIIGVWAGVVRIWPVRYSLLVLEGPPKPFVSTSEAPPLALELCGAPHEIRRQNRGPMPETDAKDGRAAHRRTVQCREQRRAAA